MKNKKINDLFYQTNQRIDNYLNFIEESNDFFKQNIKLVISNNMYSALNKKIISTKNSTIIKNPLIK
jgi:hypothetical protein